MAIRRGDRQNYTRSPCRPVTHLLKQEQQSLRFLSINQKISKILVELKPCRRLQGMQSKNQNKLFHVINDPILTGKCQMISVTHEVYISLLI